jgi:aspartyl-tRNA(Asn)/glutamyl-tRNA(Gln) amidotransferase subunit C
MPDRLTRAEVERIAALAHLELTPDEVDTFTRQLADILDYARQIQQLETSGIPPTTHVLAGRAADRPDEIATSLDRDAALANAPDAAAGFFRVPRVIG